MCIGGVALETTAYCQVATANAVLVDLLEWLSPLFWFSPLGGVKRLT